FRANNIDKVFFKLKMNNLNVAMADRERLYNSLQNLTLYSLGDIRDILILVHYFFTGKIEDLFHEPLIEYTENLSKTIEQIKIDNLLSQNYDPEIYLFLYENKILEYVKNGDIRNLENMVFNLSNGIIPSVSGDTIRSEKNYSIIVFEKLAQTSITLGMDIIEAYQSRDALIQENELAVSLPEVLKVRDSGIVYYTKEIGKTKIEHLSPLISSVVQFIGLNIYKRITVKEIANYFSVSETKLRESFKNEMHITIYNYISKRKISTAKIMLKSNHTISEVSLGLGFSDSSHFSRVFKKYAGVSPKQYQLGLVDNFNNIS
ncbi:TPA: YSIRK-targeted surface antigen transcriptional regulator, partial [Enterococcus faecium]|nr:YSIRK-targeted surface antigen transcriptional regulator [Enterococcus faecium]HAP6864327.1 YSIRK-targeted surface antigen transcriptional regulator [Enterococcus faecium]HAP7743410.1 YSIRK-targeted surface antigen transcriptional regulator [Enterococcus faecium]HAP8292384.1 YSIRK-targeted surface antigen transcriptional regulator [Enterococcus faecium]HAP9554264.1 YSIRK-targeted surface antigen transcriptional regulator [Enterococcus faecium]